MQPGIERLFAYNAKRGQSLMKIHYHCEQCGQAIDTLEVDQLNESKLGFDILNHEEKQQLIYHDPASDALYVQSLCDLCIELIGLKQQETMQPILYKSFIH